MKLIQLQDVLDKSNVVAGKWAMESEVFSEAIIPWETTNQVSCLSEVEGRISHAVKTIKRMFVRKISPNKFRIEQATQAHVIIGMKYGVKDLCEYGIC